MEHVIGSAVVINCEVPVAQVTGTVITLESLKDPDGTDYASSQALTFGTETGLTNVASVTWQSVFATHPIGTYSYVLKAVNGSYETYKKGTFTLVARP